MAKQSHHVLGTTTACTICLLEEMGEGGAAVGLKGDSLFSSIKSCAQLGARGKMDAFQVKTAHSLYPKKIIETILLGMPGGVHIGRYTSQWATSHSIGLPLCTKKRFFCL